MHRLTILDIASQSSRWILQGLPVGRLVCLSKEAGDLCTLVQVTRCMALSQSSEMVFRRMRGPSGIISDVFLDRLRSFSVWPEMIFKVTQAIFKVTQAVFKVTQAIFKVTQAIFKVTQVIFKVTQAVF